MNESLGSDPAAMLNPRMQLPVPNTLVDDIDQGNDGEPPFNTPREGLPPSFRMRHDKHYVEELMSSPTIAQGAAHATSPRQRVPADGARLVDHRSTTVDEPPRPSAAAVELIASRLESIVAHGAVSRRHAASTDLVSRMMHGELQRVSRWARAVSIRARQIEPVRRSVTAGEIAAAIRSACTGVARLNGTDCLVTTTDAGFAVSAERALIVHAIAGTVDALLDLMQSATDDSVDEGGRIMVSLQPSKMPPTLIVDVECATLAWPGAPVDRFFDNGDQDFALAPVAGILLASAAHVVRLHGGRIEVQLRGGGRIRFEFPQ